MTAMMASMQNMGMTGNMMGGQQPGNAAPKSEAAPSTPPAAAPVSPEDHEEHHPAQ
jgi:hypothetical protein